MRRVSGIWPSNQLMIATSNPSKRRKPMNRQHRFPTWAGVALGSVCALFVLALSAHAADHRGEFTEELHQTYALTQNGRVELDNINGAVHISTWDRNEVKL